MSFSESEQIAILRLKAKIASYYSIQMKKINDRHLESLFYNNCIITGGCIASLAHGDTVNDIDVYAKTDLYVTVIKEYIRTNAGKNIKYRQAYDLTDKLLITNNAVTLTNDVQFIYISNAETCRQNFDYIHCMPWYDIGKQKLHISPAQFHSIRDKMLIANPNGQNIKESRTQKYILRGWKLPESESVL